MEWTHSVNHSTPAASADRAAAAAHSGTAGTVIVATGRRRPAAAVRPRRDAAAGSAGIDRGRAAEVPLLRTSGPLGDLVGRDHRARRICRGSVADLSRTFPQRDAAAGAIGPDDYPGPGSSHDRRSPCTKTLTYSAMSVAKSRDATSSALSPVSRSPGRADVPAVAGLRGGGHPCQSTSLVPRMSPSSRPTSSEPAPESLLQVAASASHGAARRRPDDAHAARADPLLQQEQRAGGESNARAASKAPGWRLGGAGAGTIGRTPSAVNAGGAERIRTSDFSTSRAAFPATPQPLAGMLNLARGSRSRSARATPHGLLETPSAGRESGRHQPSGTLCRSARAKASSTTDSGSGSWIGLPIEE